MKNNLLVFLAKKRMTMAELSRITGISRPTLTAIKKGDCEKVRLETIKTICNALNCGIDDFIAEEV